MDNYKICKNAFYNGEKDYINGEYELAKNWYKIAKQHPKFLSESIHKLFLIDIILRRLDMARELLNTNYYIDDSLNVENNFGYLEYLEYNFTKAINYYEYCLENRCTSFDLFKKIAKCHYELGEHEEARKFLEKVKSMDKMTAKLYEAYILYNERKYEQAIKLLKSIDISKIDSSDYNKYEELLILLNYKSGIIKTIDDTTRYSYARLFDKDDELLMEHMKKHFEIKETDISKFSTTSSFKKEIDIHELIESCKRVIDNTNANHHGSRDYYRYSFDNIIGTNNNKLTKDIEIVTHLDSKCIITMYPIVVSDEFDNEKLSTSQGLKLKREKNQK